LNKNNKLSYIISVHSLLQALRIVHEFNQKYRKAVNNNCLSNTTHTY